jgi:hypothetical protein
MVWRSSIGRVLYERRKFGTFAHAWITQQNQSRLVAKMLQLKARVLEFLPHIKKPVIVNARHGA